MNSNLLTLEEVTWDKVRLAVKKVAPDIFAAIEKISPDKSYKLYRAKYPYGAMIIGEDTIFNIPQNNELLSINDRRVPPLLKEQLGYNQFGIPMSLILSGTVQLYTEEKHEKVETEGVYQPGVMLAVRSLLDTGLSYHAKRIWHMTSGVRTPIVLPSISDTASFIKLKKEFNLKHQKPSNQTEQWQLFTELANHKKFSTPWSTELLLFSKKWLANEEGDWQAFRLALFKRSWKITEYARNISAVNRIWEGLISRSWHEKVNIVIFNMVKHIIECALGQSISHAPEDGRDLTGPFEAISKILVDIYGLKKYAPIIMSPYVFDPKDNKAAYVSLQTIDSYWMSLINYKSDNLIADAREIRYRLNQFIRRIGRNDIQVEGTPFSTLPNYSFDFYHADEDLYNELLPAETIFNGDNTVARWEKTPKNAAIAHRNSFLRSCVKINLKE